MNRELVLVASQIPVASPGKSARDKALATTVIVPMQAGQIPSHIGSSPSIP
ncbi:hypothetical protein LRP52_21515 [Photobacterium sp. ZSDE20]|nr:hypothetical protein [Photobacterium sp. ZSDE20]